MQRSVDRAEEQAFAPSILLVEDEPGIVDFVRRGLQAEGFVVEAELDGTEGERRALNDSFDLIVLDLMLPGRGGLEILASLRQAKPSMPVIVLTARGETEDRVVGLDAGAVDYLVKPFSLAELAARVRVQLRLAAQATTGTLRGGDIEVNLLTRQVRRGGEDVRCRPPSSSCSCICCAIVDVCSRVIRSSARCGATSTTPPPTSWMSTSAISGAS